MEGNTRTRMVVLAATLAIVVGGGAGTPVAGAAADRGTGPTASTTTQRPVGEPAQAAAATELEDQQQVLGRRTKARRGQARTTARWSGSVNVSSRAAVNAAYWQQYAPGLQLATGWTGDDEACRAGAASASSTAATLRAINFVRSLGGLAPVRFDASLNARSQATALMMSANRTLSHTPRSSWRCYSGAGAANAGRANLALAYPQVTSSGVVGMYMKELGSSNVAVGHRRWIMNPFSTTMGSGATSTAHAMTVIGPTSSARPNPAYVAWPTAGHFPSTLEPSGRWSLSAGVRSVSFARATVRVTRNGVPVPVVKRAVHDGYAMPTLVWEMPDGIARTGTFRVTVSGIRRAGSKKRFAHTYPVAMFAPTR